MSITFDIEPTFDTFENFSVFSHIEDYRELLIGTKLH